MWQHYRKTLLPIQLFIVATIATLYFALRVDPRSVLLVFVVMEVGSLYGARMVGRAKRKIDAADALPLSNR